VATEAEAIGLKGRSPTGWILASKRLCSFSVGVRPRVSDLRSVIRCWRHRSERAKPYGLNSSLEEALLFQRGGLAPRLRLTSMAPEAEAVGLRGQSPTGWILASKRLCSFSVGVQPMSQSGTRSRGGDYSAQGSRGWRHRSERAKPYGLNSSLEEALLFQRGGSAPCHRVARGPAAVTILLRVPEAEDIGLRGRNPTGWGLASKRLCSFSVGVQPHVSDLRSVIRGWRHRSERAKPYGLVL